MARINCTNKTVFFSDGEIEVFEFTSNETESGFIVRMKSGKDYVFSTSEGGYYPITKDEYVSVWNSMQGFVEVE